MRAVYAGVQRAFRATDVPLARLAERVAAAQRQLRAAADELDSVEPPGEVSEQHREIVKGLREYADDVEELRVAAANRDQRRSTPSTRSCRETRRSRGSPRRPRR
ncbi:MAG: hypothetical protein ABR521_13270 [Gaiellaceae bacterium]